MDGQIADVILAATEVVAWAGLGVLTRGGWIVLARRLREGRWPMESGPRHALAVGGTSYALFCVALLDLTRFQLLAEPALATLVLAVAVTGAVAAWLTTRWIGRVVDDGP